jgi:hypothetical protein
MKMYAAFLPLIFLTLAILKGHYTNDGPTVLHLLIITVITQLFFITLLFGDKP